MANSFTHFFRGENIFSEQIFKYDNLQDGCFKTFVCTKSFTYDSDIFNLTLANFLRNHDFNGSFIIYRTDNCDMALRVGNSFDPLYLNARVENHDQALKLTASFICDTKLSWSIFLDNDLDIFIAWVKYDLIELFNEHFSNRNNDYYFEPNGNQFLQTMVDRVSYRKDFDELAWKKGALKNNGELFKKHSSQQAYCQ